MPQGAIARKLAREAAARAEAARRGPEPMLTVRLDEVPATADLSHLTAEAYPVPEVEVILPVSGTKKRGRSKKVKEASDANDPGSEVQG